MENKIIVEPLWMTDRTCKYRTTILEILKRLNSCNNDS